MKKNIDKGYPYRDRKILVVNLTNDEYYYSVLSTKDSKKYHGGRALAYKLWDEYADLDTINKEDLYIGAPIIFSLGAGSGIDNDFVSSTTLLTYSLLTNTLTTSNFISNKFVKAFSSLNISALVIKGRARRLSKIEIYNDKLIIDFCENLHNLDTIELQSKFKKSSSIISISSSGEINLPYSSIIVDSINVGNNGLGSSFGEKNLKAIIFETYDNEVRSSYYTKVNEEITTYYNNLPSVYYLEYANKFGWAAVEGFKYRYDPRLWGLGSEITKDCKLDWLLALALGSNLGIYDYKKAQRINDLCYELGVDPFSISIYLIWLLNAEDNSIINLKIDKDINFIDRIEIIINMLCKNNTYFNNFKASVNNLSLLYGYEENDFTSLNRFLLPLDLRGLNAYSLSLMLNDDVLVPWELFNKINKKCIHKAVFKAQIYREIAESLGLNWNAILYLVYQDSSIRKDKNKFIEFLQKIFMISEGYHISCEELIEFGKNSLFHRREIEEKIDNNIDYSTQNIPLYFSINSKSNYKKKNVVAVAAEIEKYFELFEEEKSKLYV